MDRLPSTIIFDIFSRIPVKCLARFRCVSKRWCEYIDDPYLSIIHGERVKEEPTLIMFHQHPAITRLPHTLCFHMIEPSSVTSTLKPNKIPYMEFACKKRLPTCSDSVIRVLHRGTCNGLVYISQDNCDIVTNMSVIHPLKKQCYELPPLPLPLNAHISRESCGLGFDASTNTYKMVCVLPKTNHLDLCTMVHVFGTDLWQEIPQVPPYPVHGEAIFVEGCLYWLVSFQQDKHDVLCTAKTVIWFDVSKEEFGLINPPPNVRKFGNWFDHLVDLNGQVGYVCNESLEVWVLPKKKQQILEYDEWVLYCRIDEDAFHNLFWVKLLGCRNKDGDIVITASVNGSNRYYVYVLENGVIHQVDILGQKDNCETGIIVCPNSLLSIHQGINTNCKSTREKLFGFTKSCPKY